jgi:hypothetical protein
MMARPNGHYVVFSIDNVNDVHVLAKFLRHVDTARAMNRMQGGIQQCIGMYNGLLEVSFIMREDDFNEHVKPFGFTDNQECVLHIVGSDMQASLVSLTEVKDIGFYEAVSHEEAANATSWTYRPDMDQYFIAREA